MPQEQRCSNLLTDQEVGRTKQGKIGVLTMTLQQLLGINLPIIQAPVAGVQGRALTVAVSNAGGLGSLPCALLSLEF